MRNSFLMIACSAGCLVAALPVRGSVAGLHSITQIAGGTTIDFSNGDALSQNGISFFSPSIQPITQMVDDVTGNSDAPISGYALFGFNTISTAYGWDEVGLSLASSLAGNISQNFTFTAYDMNHNVLYSDSHVFTTATIDDYNGACFFEGLSSLRPSGP